MTTSILDWFLIAINFILFIFAKQIYYRLSPESDLQKSRQIHLLRVINAVIIGLILYKMLLVPALEESWFSKVLILFVTSYVFFLVFKVYSYFIHIRYGRKRDLDMGEHISETYHSRALVLFGGSFLLIIWLISAIQILGFNNLLQAGGVLGFVGLILALTQGTWAPDMISGLIILNSNMIEEGDILQLSFDGKIVFAVVYKTKMLHTQLLDLTNNHRMMVNNTQLRNQFLQNLSKFASAKGLREKLVFSIAYDVTPKQVRDLFSQVETRLQKHYGDYYESQHPIEVAIEDVADHAVQWTIFFYTKNIKKIIKTRQCFKEMVLTVATENDISLATPLTHVVENAQPKKAIKNSISFERPPISDTKRRWFESNLAITRVKQNKRQKKPSQSD